MDEFRWFNQSQPQTLQIAVILLYINAVFGLLGMGSFLGLLLVVGFAAGAIGVANEKKWGYSIAMAAAVLQVVLLIVSHGLFGVLRNGSLLINAMFDVALVALLAHPMSRDYQRIWFK